MDQLKADVLTSAWDEAAAGYDAYFVPRFAPWVQRAVDVIVEARPEGLIVVPCCGTAPELARLRAGLPDAPLLGVDLSPGMIQRAQARLRGVAGVTLRVGDAADTQSWGQPSALLSCFGLQQLPAPADALAAWTSSLAPGGILSVIFWPTKLEEDSPFAWLGEAVHAELGVGGAAIDWGGRLGVAVERGGGELLRDEQVAATMQHADVEAFWEAALHSGRMRALYNTCGQDLMARVKARLLKRAPSGPIEHTDLARHIVARRLASPSPGCA
jgi:SAM-dependent methyltransferase